MHPYIYIRFNCDIKVGSTQCIYTILNEDHVAACATVENPRESIFNETFFLSGVFVIGSEAEATDSSLLYNFCNLLSNPTT